MNERETVEGRKTGVTRKSAASAKPKAHAGESNKGSDPRKQRKQKQREQKLSHAERKKQDEEYFESLGPRAREKELHNQYLRWETWRRRMVILSFIALFVAIAYQYSVYPANPVLVVVLWVIPFVILGIGIWISYAKQRPLGRVLGIRYGKNERKKGREEAQKRAAKQRAKQNAQEDAVKARVAEKQEKVNAREKRRLQNRAAEKQREEARKQAAGKSSKKSK
jgi:hypothetical protein